MVLCRTNISLIRLSRKGALLDCRLTETGHVKVADFNRTSVEGVYAAGDITSPMQSISVAVAQGVMAAGAGVNRALFQEDFA